jgi:uncharacterized membrane protein
MRVASIDIIRGLAMVLMALDHTNDFFGLGGSPTNPDRTTAALFLTRWITHLCAPTFFLLTGTGAYLRQRAGRGELSRYLVTRGIALIALELTVIRCLGYQFNIDYRVTFLLVIWALGWSMIALAALARLPVAAILAVGATLIGGHHVLDGIAPAAFGAAAPIWNILHVPGLLSIDSEHVVFVAYPLLPWIGVTAAGHALGAVFTWPVERRGRLLARLGAVMAVAFVLLRFINAYGDPAPWAARESAVRTVLSFLNTTKYPPSLDFLLMTLGPALLLLAAVERWPARWQAPLATFGRVPLFYYLLHFSLIHLLAVAAAVARYGEAHWFFASPTVSNYPFTRPPEWGYALPVVYGVWLLVVLVMYPLGRWYAAVRPRYRWLSFF